MHHSIAVRESARGGVLFSKFIRVLRKAPSFVLLALLSVLASSAWAASSTVVISQLYVNGGSSGAAYTNKYVELFNLSNAPVTINGWSLTYSAATGTTWSTSNKYTIPASPAVTLQPGQHYLIQLASNGANGAALPTPDASTTALNPSGTAGKIALLGPNTTLSATNACPTPTSGTVVDFIGYGSTATCSEGGTTSSTTAPVPSLTTADFRAGSGCTDSDNNAADFSAAAAGPRNSATTVAPCSGGGSSNPSVASKSATPSSVAAGNNTELSVTVAPGTGPASSGLAVTVDLSSIGGSASFPLYDDGTHGDGASGDNVFANTTTIGGSVATGGYSLPITVTDAQSRTAAAASISLTVIPPPEPHTIMEIQGHGARSSFAGSGTTLGTTYVITPSSGHQNIVTAVGAKGFFIQDTAGDNDVTTSDGVYVYIGTAPSVTVGDLVSVTGRVQEFSGSTEIAGSPAYSVVGHDDNSIPAPYDLTTNLPSTDPSTGICTAAGSAVVVPSLDGLTRNDGYQAANFACLDGMLVKMSHGIVNAPTYTTANSGTIPSPTSPNNGFYVVAGGSRSFRKPGILGSDVNRTASIPTFWGNPELVQVYYPGLGVAASSFPAAPNMPAGGIYNGGQEISLTGIIQGFQSATMPDPTYEIYPRSGSDLALISSPTYPVAVSDPVAGKLTIGTQNMLHFFNNTADGADTSQYNDTCAGTGADDTCPTAAQYATRLKKISLQLRTVLKAPLVQVAQEAENYSVLTDIANQVHSDDASITYHPYLIPGNDPGGINIGILVRDGVTVNSVTQIYGNAMTTACSSGGTCLLNDRPPVLLDAAYQGYRFRVLAIYDRSLGNLGVKDYVGQKRREQAEQVAAIVQALQTTGNSVSGNAQQDSSGSVTNGVYPLAGDETVPVIILGDFNAYEFSDGYVDVTGTIMGTVDADTTHSVYPPTAGYVRPNPVLFDTGSAVSQAQHYSYNFQGLLQEIDHILLTSVGQSDFVSVQSGRGNSDISVASLTLTQDSTPMRTSDHDGQVITLGYVVTPSAGNGGAISPATVQTVSSTKPVVFTVTPDSGNQASVTDTCGSGGAAAGSFDSGTNTYTIPVGVNKDCQVTASFSAGPVSYTVTTAVSGAGGTISAPAQSSVVQSSSTTFTVTALGGYSIGSVTGDTCSPSVQSGNTYTTGAITANCTITATFTADPVNGACGSDSGSTFTSLASNDPNLCSAGTVTDFSGSGPWTWTCSGSNGGTNSSTCSAGKAYTVTASAGSNGSITPSSQNVASGSTASFTVTPAAGYRALVTGDTCTVTRVGITTAWTSSAITADCAVTANFVPDYVPLNPARLMDTRPGAGNTTVDGTAQGIGAIASLGTFKLPVANRGGVPASGVVAVALNVTAIVPTRGGYLTVWSGNGAAPNAANLNLNPGYTIPNLVISQIDSNGEVSIYNGGLAAQDVVVDVQGYFPVGTSYVPMTPERYLDTRAGGTTIDGQYQAGGAVASQGQLDLGITGRTSIPAANVGAVVLNVAAVQPTKVGFITAWPFGQTQPNASNLNLNRGLTIPNLVISGLGSGQVSLFNGSNDPTNLIADVQGWFPSDSSFTTLTPARLLDTRAGSSTIDTQYQAGGAIASGDSVDLTVTNRGGVPATGVGAVVLNVTAVQPTKGGFITVWPTGSTRPMVSNLNLNPGTTIPNLVIAKVGSNGQVSIYSGGVAPTDIVVDVQGWFPGGP